MTKIIKHILRKLHFKGGRFKKNTGWLDFDILPEFLAYKNLLVEIAKEEWKRKNPDRERLPRGFEDDLHLGFTKILDGSCTVPVERLVEYENDSLELYTPDEIDDAADIIDFTLIAANANSPLPEQLPQRVIPLFDEWGNNLNSDESIILDEKNGKHPEYNQEIKRQIKKMQKESYEDIVDIIGEVRGAKLKSTTGGNFKIKLENGNEVPGDFSAEQERIITEGLHEHKIILIHIKGLAEFDPTGNIRKILRIDQIEEQPGRKITYDPDAPSIWDEVIEIGESIPTDEWDKVPEDLSTNLKHYLYSNSEEGDE